VVRACSGLFCLGNLVQKRCHTQAAKRFVRQLLSGKGYIHMARERLAEIRLKLPLKPETILSGEVTVLQKD